MKLPTAKAIDESEAAQHAAAAAFQHLKPLCSQLLYVRDAPQQLLMVLTDLQAAAADVDHLGLLRCFDYVTYPLLFMLDSIASTRVSSTAAASGAGGSPGGSSSSSAVPVPVPAMKSDAAAEAVLDCLLLLLRRVGGWLESDQVAALLQRLTVLLQLNRQQAGEEMFVKILQCVAALLQPQPCQQQQQQQQSSCPTAATDFLGDPAAAPLTGMLISQCLAAAAAEVVCGSTGSRAVRRAAVVSLTAVVAAVGPGAPLAAFLPGLATGITQQLAAAVPPSGAPVTGAVADSSTAVLLIQLLADVIKLTLGDVVVQNISTQQQQQQQQQPQAVLSADCDYSIDSNPSSTVHLLAALEQLSQAASKDNGGTIQQQQQQEVAEGVVKTTDEPAQQQQQQQQVPAGRSLSVECNAEWLTSSSSKVQTLLALTLPRLMTHKQPAVRTALAAAAAELLQHCGRALHNSRQALLEILLTLATDEYQQVSGTALAYLKQSGAVAQATTSSSSSSNGVPHRAESSGALSAGAAAAAAAAAAVVTVSKSAAAARIFSAAQLALTGQQPAVVDSTACDNSSSSSDAGSLGSSSSSSDMLGDLAVSLCIELPAGVSRSESAGIAAARRAAAALLCAGSEVMQRRLLNDSSGVMTHQMCEALTATFQLETSTAPLLLRAGAATPGGEIAAAAAVNGVEVHLAGGSNNDNSSNLQGASSTDQSPAAAAAAASHVRVRRAGHPTLPRMPLSLKYLISGDSYMAAAAVARALGRAARLVDSRQKQQQLTKQGSSALQLITEQLLSMMWTAAAPHHNQQQQQHVSSSLVSAVIPAAGEWQCAAAAVVVVLTEVMFGASAAWTAPISADISSNAQQQQQQQQQQSYVPVMDTVYKSVLVQVVTAVTSPRLWDLPTSNTDYTAATAAAGSPHNQQLPVQALGANALLLHCVVDCVGTAARCAGSHFISTPRLLRATLLPLLERLADPCPLVAAAAAAALDSICENAGYPQGLSHLVADNADYVIDGVCKRLRNLSHHPRAPQLLSCLLRQAGVGQQLLPLLTEPLRAALSGVSILARKQQPEYVLPFLHVLQSVAEGAALEAEATRHVFRTQLTDTVAAAAAAGLFDTAASEGELSSCCGDDGDAGGVEDDADGDVLHKSGKIAARYFRQRLNRSNAGQAANNTISNGRQQQRQRHRSTVIPCLSKQPAASDPDLDLDQIAALPPDGRLQLDHCQLEDLELAWRRAYSAAALAAAAVESATPLILQHNLRSSVLAMSVLIAALKALAAATEALDIEERMFDLLLVKAPDAAMKPARPAPVKLLPAVHGIWPVLLACLQDTGSVALIEQGLRLMAQIMKLAGGRFMARRFKQEGWPLLVRLLKQGPQAGAATLAAAAAAGSTGGGPAAAALLGVGPGPGGIKPGGDSSGSRAGLLGLAGSVTTAAAGGGGGGSTGALQSALQSLGSAAAAAARSSSWNEAHGTLVSSERHMQETHEQLAPTTLNRVRTAALMCMQEICAHQSAAYAVQGHMIWDMCVLAVPYLAASQPAVVREAAVKLLVAAAQVDADAVWLLLVDLAGCQQDLSQLLSVEIKKTAAQQESTEAAGSAADAVGCGQLTLAKLQQVLPPPSAAVDAHVRDKGVWVKLLCTLGPACGKHAAVLLQGMSKRGGDIGWHSKARQQLVQLRAPC